jgi:tryptophan-rich sensory protein
MTTSKIDESHTPIAMTDSINYLPTKAIVNPFHRTHLRTTVLCLLSAVVALFLAQLPNDTQSEWFRSLVRPEILPRSVERQIGLIWTTIFMLAGLGTAASLATSQPAKWKLLQVGLILGALVLNMSYTFCFTYMHHLWLSTGVAITLALLLLVLVSTVAWQKVWLSVFCHLPHLGWVCFASYVTAQMAQLN